MITKDCPADTQEVIIVHRYCDAFDPVMGRRRGSLAVDLEYACMLSKHQEGMMIHLLGGHKLKELRDRKANRLDYEMLEFVARYSHCGCPEGKHGIRYTLNQTIQSGDVISSISFVTALIAGVI